MKWTKEDIKLLNEMKDRCLNKGQYVDEKAKDKFKLLCHLEDFVIQYYELEKRIDKTDKFLEELISSTKGVINDYSYHKEHNKILIELFEEDIEFYKKALDILRGDE